MSGITQFDKDHMVEILEDGAGKHYNWFTCYLLRLYQKADRTNRAKIASIYPEEAQAFEDWFNS